MYSILWFNQKENILITDASPIDISAVLIQKTPGQNDDKIVAYSSRAHTETVYGCERNRLYLLGRQCTIYSDHKAIINILNNPRSVGLSVKTRMGNLGTEWGEWWKWWGIRVGMWGIRGGKKWNHGENLRIGVEMMNKNVERDINERKRAHL